MPIKIPAELPAYRALDGENIFVMTDERAERQDIRPLEIVIVNLMPTKISTETQLLRLLGNSPLQVNITLLRTAEHVSAHTPAQHLERFYQTFEEIRDRSFDGMVVTGAPVEHLPFENVDYWGELLRIMEYTRRHVYSTLYICWAASTGSATRFCARPFPAFFWCWGQTPAPLTCCPCWPHSSACTA